MLLGLLENTSVCCTHCQIVHGLTADIYFFLSTLLVPFLYWLCPHLDLLLSFVLGFDYFQSASVHSVLVVINNQNSLQDWIGLIFELSWCLEYPITLVFWLILFIPSFHFTRTL